MSLSTHQPFAQVLDELIAESRGERVELGSTPALQVDLFEQIERLQHENQGLFDGPYDDVPYAAEGLAPEVLDVLDALMPDLPTEPDRIEQELALHRCSSRAELDAVRRSFAFKNHPDRLAPHLRERAETRMRIANALIDNARRALKADLR